MAAVSTLAQQRRKKPSTYGKSSRNVNGWDVTSFNDLEEHDRLKKLPTKTSSSAKKHSPPFSLTHKSHNTGVSSQRGKQRDAWDVPSSEDEAPSPIRVTTPPSIIPRNQRELNIEEVETKLAPWEGKKRSYAHGSIAQSQDKRRRLSSSHSDDQPAMDILTTVPEGGLIQESSKPTKSDHVRSSEIDQAHPPKDLPALSAAARLHAKRSQASISTNLNSKDPVFPSFESQRSASLSRTNPHYRKRIRTEVHVDGTSNDQEMVDALPVSIAQDSKTVGYQELNTNKDIFNSSIPARTRGKVGSSYTTKAQSTWQPRKTKITHFRTSDHLPNDSDTPEATSRSPSAPGSDPTTPQPLNGSTDPSLNAISTKASSPGSNDDTLNAMTPKQANLWKNLLPSDTSGPSPSTLSMHNLKITSRKVSTTAAPSAFSINPRRRSFAGKRRTRLVDRLKASAPESDEDVSGQSEAESEESTQEHANSTEQELEEPLPTQQSQSQSQSQSTRAPDGGPRITYARDRSYLREESFEEGLMLELAGDTPQRPLSTAFRRMPSKNASQKSAFDLDESDDDAGSGRIRTIHELRAGGENQRFMDDIGGLLDDIADHNISARSRRRSALMEIATKLSDRPYAEKFLRQGFEKRLIDECGSTPDEIADFTTTTAIVMLTLSDLPEHTLKLLKDRNYLQFLLRLMSLTVDIRRSARDRSNNMSKSAQASFVEFVDKLADQQSIWGETKPSLVTSRLIALKSMEQVVQNLRQFGDRSDLVNATDMTKIWSSEADQILGAPSSVEDCLAVSVLECLSTSTLSLAWPHQLVRQLGNLLVLPETSKDDSRHTTFLALRLCTNLSNGNVRNCKALTTSTTVHSLLQATQKGFSDLDTASQDENRAIRFDILVLSMGILMNLAEHNERACAYARNTEAAGILGDLVTVCQDGQKRALEAESEEESTFNVAYGYLAVTLAQFCRDVKTKDLIASRLPGNRLDALVVTVEEFVNYHIRVDTLSSEGGEGTMSWSAFTEKLKGILTRLKIEAGMTTT